MLISYTCRSHRQWICKQLLWACLVSVMPPCTSCFPRCLFFSQRRVFGCLIPWLSGCSCNGRCSTEPCGQIGRIRWARLRGSGCSAWSTCNLSSIYTMSIYTIGLPNTGLAQPIFTAADNQIFFPFLEIRFYSACILSTKIDAGFIRHHWLSRSCSCSAFYGSSKV
jgi:hypothetical protein